MRTSVQPLPFSIRYPIERKVRLVRCLQFRGLLKSPKRILRGYTVETVRTALRQDQTRLLKLRIAKIAGQTLTEH